MNIYPKLDQVEHEAKQGHRLIPLGCQLPSDTLTPVSAFLRLRQSGSVKAFLLESADGGEDVGRYSFIGIEPFASLVSREGELIFTHFQKTETLRDTSSFQKVEALIQEYQSSTLENFPPFAGGAVGFVSYDSIQMLEDIPLPDLGLGTDDIHLLLFKNILAFDRLKHRLYLVTHIENDGQLQDRYRSAGEELQRIKDRIFRRSPDEDLAFYLDNMDTNPIETEPLLGRERYCQGVKKIKKHIRDGDIFQCVLSDRFRFPFKQDPFMVYRVLKMINPSPYLFYLSLGEGEYLLGSSPEMLVKSQGGQVETCPIAGTRPRGKDLKEDKKFEAHLLDSVKEKAEHLMLVDLGRNDIGRVSKPGTVRVRDFMKVERYSHVMHLVSLVEGQLEKRISSWQALGSCFPAGTLSGAPKIRAMEIISEIETQRRGPYGGAVVCYDFIGGLNSCITIRSLYVRDGMGYVQAGAGIVADSRPDKEYDEVLNKAKAILSAVAIAHKNLGDSG